MNNPDETANQPALAAPCKTGQPRLPEIFFWVVAAAVAFHAAYGFREGGILMGVSLFALLQLARVGSWRKAWYSGLTAGLLIAVPKLAFFFRIFGGGAIALWLIYGIWIALFVALARLSLIKFGPRWGWLPMPFLWLGLEYFRSELYYLRFSWLNAGYAFSAIPSQVFLGHLGMYGVGFLLMAVAAGAACVWLKSRIQSVVIILVVLLAIWTLEKLPAPKPALNGPSGFRVVGIQMEFPTENEVLLALNDTTRKFPDAQLLVLSEYTFNEPPPEKIRQWCRSHKHFLIVGGEDSAPGGGFYNTAFVIGPSGEIVFKQGKCVPIQFFKDGIPAPEQKIWESPWGKIGICICYDLSYTRVTDRLIELGAQALIVPTMDVADWGSNQHELHARVAPVRAAEYGVPIFRLASSGISQSVDENGRVKASAPFPGDGATLADTVSTAYVGTLPWDRWLAPLSTGITGVLILWFSFSRAIEGWRRRKMVLKSEISHQPVHT